MLSRIALILGVVTLLVARWWGKRPTTQYEPQESLVCKVGAACEPTWRTFFHPFDNEELSSFPFPPMPPEQTMRVLQAILDRCERISKAGSLPIILHVGANDMRKESAEYRYLLSRIKVPHRLVLVEPNTKLMPKLEKQAATLDSGANTPKVINAAVCPTSGQDMTLYVPSPDKILADFPLHRVLVGLGLVNPEVLSEVASLSYERTANSLKMLHRVPEVHEHYIDKISVRCATPAELIADVGASASDVASIAVDTEGFDAQLLAMFLQVDEFRPAVVTFEWAGHHGNETDKVNALTNIVKALHGRGYDLYKSYENMVATVP